MFIGLLWGKEELMGTAEIIAVLDKEIAQLQQVRNLLDGHQTGNGRITTQAVRRLRLAGRR
jgi:hypothetical protein